VRLAWPRHRRGLPLADLAELHRAARRTTLVRVGLGVALAATLGGLLLSARAAGSGRASVLPAGTSTGVVVLDMSASISGPVYARVASTLESIVQANQAVGLVMFSDVGYELLPPNSPAGELLEFVPYFIPVRYYQGAPIFETSPWDNFSGGTRISTGLGAARLALERAHVRHGAIVLVSDLDEASGDDASLMLEALKLRQLRIPVRIVPLFPDPTSRAYFAGLFGRDAFLPPQAFSRKSGRHVALASSGPSWSLLGLGALLALLLAGNELLNARLEPEERE
jgi:hypothetical protein